MQLLQMLLENIAFFLSHTHEKKAHDFYIQIWFGWVPFHRINCSVCL